MPRDAANIKAHELIGLRATVQSSANEALTGINGEIRDETKNTITLHSRQRLVTLPKSGTSLAVETDDGKTVTIHGEDFKNRPEDRVKKGLSR